jgi:tripartite-type tricarboxylate transporter receptor subunit TctC
MSLAGIVDKVAKIPTNSMGEATRVVGAGEGDICNTRPVVVMPHFQGGRMDVLLIMGDSVPPPWDKNPNVVTMKQAGLPPLPIGTVFGLGVPKQVPQAHVDWLYKLIKAGASTDHHKKRQKVIPGLTVDIRGPAEANALKMDFYEKADPIVRKMGIHVDQQK